MTSDIERGDSHAGSPLRIRDFRVFWLANTLVAFGVHLQATVALWLMLELTGSATWVALMAASNFIPVLTFGLVAGVASDLVGRVRMMIISMGVAVTASVVLAVLAILDALVPGALLGVGLMFGAALSFRQPAWLSTVPDLVPDTQVARAMGIVSLSANIALIVGPVTAGVILAAGEPAFGFLGAAATLVVMTAVVVATRHRLHPPHPPEVASIRSGMATGLRFARHAPMLRRVLIVTALFGLAAAHVQALLPSRVEELGRGESTFSVVLALFGTGALVGTLTRPVLGRVLGAAMLPTALAVFAGSTVLSGAVSSIVVFTPALVLAGAAWMWVGVTVWSLTQLLAPHWVRGRTVSIVSVAQAGFLAIGGTAAGALADRFGPGRIAIAFGASVLAVALLSRRFHIPAVEEIEPIRFSEPAPQPRDDIEGGPILVLNTWRVSSEENLERFISAMSVLRGIRLRSGAIGWDLYRDTSDPHRLTEAVRFSSWDDHMAMHRRLDDRSRSVVRSLIALDDEGSPFSRHLVSVDPRVPADWELLVEAHDAFHAADNTLPLRGSERDGRPAQR